MITATFVDEICAWLARIASPLVTRPESVCAMVAGTTNSLVVIALTVAPVDVGCVVGKRGAVVLALRTLTCAFGHRRVLEVVVVPSQSRLGERRRGA